MLEAPFDVETLSFDGIPQIMSEEEFRQTYSDVESPEYDAMIARIEAKIDELALHQH